MSEIFFVATLVAIGVVITLLNSVDLVAIVALALQERFGWPRNVKTGSEKLLGQTGIAVGEFQKQKGLQEGRIRIHGESWKALSTSEDAIVEGAEVKVLKVEGLSVFVNLSEDAK